MNDHEGDQRAQGLLKEMGLAQGTTIHGSERDIYMIYVTVGQRG